MCQHNNNSSNNNNNSNTQRNDFFCSSLFTQKKSAHHYQHNKNKHLTSIASIDMSDMFPGCIKNDIYVSNTSYNYTEIDMINLFGSPAGRAINKITSIKLNKSDDEMKDKTNAATTNQINKDILTNRIQQNVSKAISGSGSGTNSIKKAEKYTNLNKKKVKCWKFLEEDKLNNNCTNATVVERSAELITTEHRQSTGIYDEAAHFLSFSCTLSNSCRCLECQSRYFDFDDEDDDDDDCDDFFTNFDGYNDDMDDVENNTDSLIKRQYWVD